MYDCKRCGKKIVNKYYLIKHLNLKKKCLEIHSNISTEDYIKEIESLNSVIDISGTKFYICKICKTKFKSKSSKSRHQTLCEEKYKILSQNKDVSSNANTIINNTINNNTTNMTNKGLIINVNTEIDDTVLDIINEFITEHRLINQMVSFPSYSIEHLFENDFECLKNNIIKCKKEEKDPKNSFKDDYNFALNLFIDIFKSNDYRTMNTFIKEVNDNVAYCYLDSKFYSISTEKLFEIFFHHLHDLLKKVIKIKDTYNGFNKADSEYINCSLEYFNKYLKTTDKTEFKKEILNCMYYNKCMLTDLLNSASPIEKFKDTGEILTINSNLVNNIREKKGLPIHDYKINLIPLDVNNNEIKYRDSKKIIISTKYTNNIEIDIERSPTRVSPGGALLYRTVFLDIPIWYDPVKEVGFIDINTRKTGNQPLIPKDKLLDKVYKIINISNCINDDQDGNYDII